jgi:hypothetical protein
MAIVSKRYTTWTSRLAFSEWKIRICFAARPGRSIGGKVGLPRSVHWQARSVSARLADAPFQPTACVLKLREDYEAPEIPTLIGEKVGIDPITE